MRNMSSIVSNLAKSRSRCFNVEEESLSRGGGDATGWWDIICLPAQLRNHMPAQRSSWLLGSTFGGSTCSRAAVLGGRVLATGHLRGGFLTLYKIVTYTSYDR